MRTNKVCGHPDKKHCAKGMCRSCYYKVQRTMPKNRDKKKAYYAVYSAKPENKARTKVRMDAYRARPEIRARDKAYRTSYYASPEGKAKRYCHNTGIPVNEALPYMQILESDRMCYMCDEPGATHLDHNHKTLEIRGWAHESCNRAEGIVSSSPNPKKLMSFLAKNV